MLINWLRSCYIVFIILSDRYICATWLLETANEKSFWFCVWYDRRQPYNFYECVCVLATWLGARMNARDSNIILFILSKLKQLLNINAKNMVVFPSGDLYLLSFGLDNLSCKQSTESFNRNDKKSVHVNVASVYSSVDSSYKWFTCSQCILLWLGERTLKMTSPLYGSPFLTHKKKKIILWQINTTKKFQLWDILNYDLKCWNYEIKRQNYELKSKWEKKKLRKMSKSNEKLTLR